MTFAFKEVSYSKLADLVREATATGAFLPLRGDDEPFLHSLADCAGHEGYFFFALLDDLARAVGFVVILPHQQEGVASVGPVYVGAGYRGKGLGRQLIEETIRWAKGKGIRRLFTKTWGRNVRSRRLFEGAGFRMVKEEPDTRVNGDSTVEYLLEVG